MIPAAVGESENAGDQLPSPGAVSREGQNASSNVRVASATISIAVHFSTKQTRGPVARVRRCQHDEATILRMKPEKAMSISPIRGCGLAYGLPRLRHYPGPVGYHGVECADRNSPGCASSQSRP